MWYTDHHYYLDFEIYYLTEEIIQVAQSYQFYALSNFRMEKYFLEGLSE